MYGGWETVSPTGALLIKDSQLNDTGSYTVRVDTINDTQRATVWLEIRGEWAAAPLPDCTELNLEFRGVVFLGAHRV